MAYPGLERNSSRTVCRTEKGEDSGMKVVQLTTYVISFTRNTLLPESLTNRDVCFLSDLFIKKNSNDSLSQWKHRWKTRLTEVFPMAEVKEKSLVV